MIDRYGLRKRRESINILGSKCEMKVKFYPLPSFFAKGKVLYRKKQPFSLMKRVVSSCMNNPTVGSGGGHSVPQVSAMEQAAQPEARRLSCSASSWAKELAV